jgi:hypothetical protein
MIERWVFLSALAIFACERPSSRAPIYPPPPQQQPMQPGPPPGPQPGNPNLPPRSNDDIARVINAAYPTFTECYRQSESYMTAKSGTATIFFDIAPAGHVLRATPVAPPGIAPQPNPLNDARLDACLVRAFFGLKFPPARDESAASFTFSFGV